MQQNHLTTEVFAKSLGLKPQTLISALWRKGSYYGVKPAKLPNGRLLWPADAANRIITGEAR